MRMGTAGNEMWLRHIELSKNQDLSDIAALNLAINILEGDSMIADFVY